MIACRFFYASSACIYPEFKQLETNVSLKESDAWPAEVCPVLVIKHFWSHVGHFINISPFRAYYFPTFSLKMLMAWRSLLPRSYASIIPRTLASNVGLAVSITSMAHSEHGKVIHFAPVLLFAHFSQK